MISDTSFDILARHIRKHSAIVIEQDKIYLLESRLSPVARKHELSDLDEIAKTIADTPSHPVGHDVIEAMTTNETSFMRDGKPFTRFEKLLLPYLLKARAHSKKIRIWCAACSSGQEPYSLAMILKEMGAKLSGWNIEIVGTDLSHEMVERCKQGKYSQFEVQRGLPVTHLVKYFVQDNESWILKDDIKNMASFKQMNLLNDFKSLGTFDIIFCRNVLIYFDRETKQDILHRLSQNLADDGFLMLGGAETVMGLSDDWANLQKLNGVYVRKDKELPQHQEFFQEATA